MTNTLTFEVLGVSQPQGSSRAFVNNGRAVITSSNPNLRDWRNLVAREAREAMKGDAPFDCSMRLRIAFWLPRPKSVKRAEPTVKPDLDKLVRAVLDGLTGIVYRDDAQVVAVEAEKRYVEPSVPHPCATITVLS